MMTPRIPWRIEPVSLDDASAIARNNLSAFWSDPGWPLSWPNAELGYLIEQQTKRIPKDLINNREVLRNIKAVNPETGKLVGFARFELPASHTHTADGQATWPEAQTADVTAEKRKQIEETHASAVWEPFDDGAERNSMEIQQRILSEGTYLKLRYLAVHPESQNKGVGTALVQSGIQKAEELGINVYIMALEAGRRVYKKLGFREIEKNIEDLANYGGQGEWATYFMVYDTKNNGGNQESL